MESPGVRCIAIVASFALVALAAAVAADSREATVTVTNGAPEVRAVYAYASAPVPENGLCPVAGRITSGAGPSGFHVCAEVVDLNGFPDVCRGTQRLVVEDALGQLLPGDEGTATIACAGGSGVVATLVGSYVPATGAVSGAYTATVSVFDHAGYGPASASARVAWGLAPPAATTPTGVADGALGGLGL